MKVKVMFTQNYPKLITINCRRLSYSRNHDRCYFAELDEKSKAVLSELNKEGGIYIEFSYDGEDAVIPSNKIQRIVAEDK